MKFQPLFRSLLKAHGAVFGGKDITVLSGRSIQHEREVERTALFHIVGKIKYLPLFVRSVSEGVIGDFGESEFSFAERNSKNRPKRCWTVRSNRENQFNRVFFFNSYDER